MLYGVAPRVRCSVCLMDRNTTLRRTAFGACWQIMPHRKQTVILWTLNNIRRPRLLLAGIRLNSSHRGARTDDECFLSNHLANGYLRNTNATVIFDHTKPKTQSHETLTVMCDQCYYFTYMGMLAATVASKATVVPIASENALISAARSVVFTLALSFPATVGHVENMMHQCGCVHSAQAESSELVVHKKEMS